MRHSCWLLLAALLLVACGVNSTRRGPGGTGWGRGAFDSNGERIYFTATSDRGTRITYTGGPGTGMMMGGGNLTCASCHGPDARGGRHRMHMDVMDAPDVRWSVLAGEAAGQGEAGAHEDEHTEAQGGYDLETFRQAVVAGKHPDGEPLSRDMPRWRMSDEDLADLAQYLQTLP